MLQSGEVSHGILALTIARRFLRAHAGLAASGAVVCAGFVLLLSHTVLQAQSLTGEQLAERDLGRFDAMTGFGVRTFPPGSSIGSVLERRLARGDDTAVALVADEFPIPLVGHEGTFFKEMDWVHEPFPDRYVVKKGRLPSRPGEIAFTDLSLPEGVHVGDPVPVLGGKYRFTLVGLADDDYSSTRAVLAGPGTWEELPESARVGNNFLTVSPIVYTSGRPVDQVVVAVSDVLRDLPAQSQAFDGPSLETAVRDSVITRSEVSSHDEKSWILKSPAGYLLPSLLVPPLTALFAVAVSGRRLVTSIRRMQDVGIDARTATIGPWTAVTLLLLGAAVSGGVLGTATGIGVAHLIARVADTPTPTWAVPLGPMLSLLATTLVGAALGLPMLARMSRERMRNEHRSSPRRGRDARHVLAAVAGCIGVLRLLSLDSAADAMVFMGTIAVAMLALAWDFVPWLVGRLPEAGLTHRMIRRQLVADSARVSAAVVTLALSLGLTMGFVTLLSAMIRTAELAAYPQVNPGQVMLADRSTDTARVPPGTLRAAQTVPAIHNQEPIELTFAGDPTTEFQSRLRAGDSIGLIFVVESLDQLLRLTQWTPDDQIAQVLESGGIVVWDEMAGDKNAPMGLRLVSGEKVTRDLGQVPSMFLTQPEIGWATGTTGVILSSTAQALGVEAAGGALIYTDISQEDATAVLDALATSGLDPETARIYAEPPPPIPPAALYTSAAMLVLLTLWMSLAATRGQVAALRARLGHLVALGLAPTWARRVVVGQQLVILVLAVAAASVTAVPPVLLAIASVPGFAIDVPASQLSVIVLAFISANLIATILTASRLRASEWRKS